MHALAFAPSDPRIVYAFNAATLTPDVYRSVDGGSSWRRVGDSPDEFISHALVAPSDPLAVYAGAWSSTDGGRTWTMLPFEGCRNGRLLAVDPEDPNTVYAACGEPQLHFSRSFGVSHDGGSTWTMLLYDSVWIYDAVIDASAGTIYVATGGRGIVETEDGGATWTPASTGLVAPTTHVTMSPTRSDVLYATNGRQVFRSTDGASTWSRVGALAASVTSLVVARDPGTLYAQLFDGHIWKSADSGRTWAKVAVPMVSAGGIAVDPAGRSILSWGLGDGVVRSTDGGSTWVASNDGLLEAPVEPDALAVDPADGTTAYAVSGGRLFKTDDAGGHWNELAPQFALRVASVSIAPDGSAVYVGLVPSSDLHEETFDDGGIYRSTDGGATWSNLSPELMRGGRVLRIVIDPNAPRVLYADVDFTCQCSHSAIYRTGDGGGHWSIVFDGWTGLLAMNLAHPSTLYAGGTDGLRTTNDGGRHWTKLSDEVLMALASDRTDPTRLYGTVSDPALGHMLVRSTDGGASWSTSESVAATGVWVKPGQPNVLYAWGEGLSRSTDGGSTWHDLGLPGYVLSFATTRTEDLIYAGTPKGVYVLQRGQ